MINTVFENYIRTWLFINYNGYIIIKLYIIIGERNQKYRELKKREEGMDGE